MPYSFTVQLNYRLRGSPSITSSGENTLAATVCAMLAGSRSFAAIAEWIADPSVTGPTDTEAEGMGRPGHSRLYNDPALTHDR